VRRRMGMGLGDVKLLAMLAAWLGLRQTGLVLFLAVVAGALYGLGMILVNRSGVNRRADTSPGQLPVPFGTMLSLAGLYSIFLGERTLGWYMQLFH
jgi:leader peptidase (prepilin peptidase) / N-methyltransferase